MQEFTQKYTLISLLEEKAENSEFSSADWPLHITIADTFAVDWNDSLTEKLSDLVTKQRVITSVAGHDEYFGSDQQTQVTILDTNEALLSFHYDCISLLKTIGTVFNDPQYIESGYRPHVTVRPHARLQRGDHIQLTGLSVVDMFPRHDPYKRKILKTISFAE